jgi:hypothetical protein
MAIEFIKTLFIPSPSWIYTNWDIWFESIPSGNPGYICGVDLRRREAALYTYVPNVCMYICTHIHMYISSILLTYIHMYTYTESNQVHFCSYTFSKLQVILNEGITCVNLSVCLWLISWVTRFGEFSPIG